MRQNSRRQPTVLQNLDSFLDILTNTVGVLMFVGLFISLVAVESSSIIRTPLVSETDKEAYSFEVRNNRVIDIVANYIVVEQELADLSLQACEEPQLSPNITEENVQYHIPEFERFVAQFEKFKSCLDENREKLNDFRVMTPDYNVSAAPDSLSLIYKPLQVGSSPILQESEQEHPQLQRALSQLDPEANYIVFIVRPDSFEEFRQARELAWGLGFDVGWEPFTSDKELVLLPSVLSDLAEVREILPQ